MQFYDAQDGKSSREVESQPCYKCPSQTEGARARPSFSKNQNLPFCIQTK